MKRILVTAGGTATAWHICRTAEEYFKDSIEVFICDTNDPYLVPSVVTARKVFKVPPVSSPDYPGVIGKIIDDEGIDVIVPLIPAEAYLFASDGDFVKDHGIISTAAPVNTTDLLADKLNLYKTLKSLGIPTPAVYDPDELEADTLYLLKPRLGFGSAGVIKASGRDIRPDDDTVIQELCHDDDYDEITVEIFNYGADPRIYARRRIATKAGVCVKAEPVDTEPFYGYIKKLTDNVDCPRAFNVQFLRHKGQWKLFDCNLRLGAGTALSSAAGFDLTRGLLACLAGLTPDGSWFEPDRSVRSVLRVYQEIVIR